MQFAEIIGHDEIKRKLIQTVLENRVSHAQMFLGPGGSGKLALAIAYAQYINCAGRSETDSCGVCPSCQQIARLAHPDLHFSYPIILKRETRRSKDYITLWREYLAEKHFYPDLVEWTAKMDGEKKQSVIGVDECTEIIHSLSYKSYEGKYKIMIIWMAELIYHAAAPKILKILEEPPEKTLFILLSEKQERIISTILSRTQILKVPQLDDQSLKLILSHRFGYPGDAIQRVLKSSGGNVNRALWMLEEFMNSDFAASEFRDWMLMSFRAEFKELTAFVSKIARTSRAKQKQFLSYGLSLSRNCLLTIYGRNDMLTIVDDEEAAFVGRIAKYLNEKNALEYASLFEEAIRHIDRNANASLVFMDVSLKAAELLNPALSEIKR
ncbi:MAG: DNA polymerase III subunit [Bacteroidales bacterium]|nr:DNA polymerase III subunit [Bacteroidales bacterium]